MVSNNGIASLVRPGSICIVGATETSLFVRKVVGNLEAQGFSGKVYMVNPKYNSVFRYPCYPSVLDVPGDILDLLLKFTSFRPPVFGESAGDDGNGLHP